MASTCSYNIPIPKPATSKPSCVVPIGNSNSTILDTCCNGHINTIQTLRAPNATADCYLFCTTDTVRTAEQCLNSKLGPYNAEKPTFQCFDGVAGKKESKNYYEENAGERLRVGRGVLVVLGLGLLGSVMSVV